MGGAEEEGAPILEVTGNNPATIQVGDTYSDLGAIITGPTENDVDLGITVLLDGVEVQYVEIDTSTAGEYTVEYRATNSAGTASATRTVIVSSEGGSASGGEAPAVEEEPAEEPALDVPPASADEPLATDPPADEPAPSGAPQP